MTEENKEMDIHLPFTPYPKSKQLGYFTKNKKSLKKFHLDAMKNNHGYSRPGLEWSMKVREKDGCLCQRCGRYDKHIHTHHVIPRSLRPDLKHDVSNGMCLCGPCHRFVHDHKERAMEQGYLKGST